MPQPRRFKFAVLVSNVNAQGKTTVIYYDDPDITFLAAKKRDLANACIFPAQAPSDMIEFGKEVITAVNRIPHGHRHHVFQVMMDLLETCWQVKKQVPVFLQTTQNANMPPMLYRCSIQIVTLAYPADPDKVVEVPGMFKVDPPSEEDKKRMNLAKKIVGTRSLVAWILDECAHCYVWVFLAIMGSISYLTPFTHTRDTHRVPKPAEVYSTILTRPISERMKRNADTFKRKAMLLTQDEPLMRDMLNEALQNSDSFARGVELLKVPETTA